MDYLERKFLTLSCFIYCPHLFFPIEHKDMINWRLLLEQKVNIDGKKTIWTKSYVNLVLSII